jgi:anti-sigma factor RsiW
MDYEAQLKLQAYLDGELPEAETREVANRLARDQEAVALLGELRQTRKAVAGFEDGIRLPESREFYWSKISREIERQKAIAPPAAPRIPFWARLRYVLVPLAGAAMAALVAFLGLPAGGHAHGSETTLADSGAFTYHDYSAGTTLVWLSAYPADNEAGETDELAE